MYEEIINLIKCPFCESKLSLAEISKEGDEIIHGRVVCECGNDWLIESGVLKFDVNEQEDTNQWSKIIEEVGSYTKLNEIIKEKTPKNQKELGKEAIDHVIKYINHKSPNYILDIATGRGTLLENLVGHLRSEIHMVCTDLSFFVLKEDRKVIKKNFPNVKVSYIACDAKDLPFIDNSFDLIVTFHGVANMRDVIPEALQEINRVLKKGKNFDFLDISILVKPHSKSVEELKQFYNERGIYEVEDFITEKGFKNFHKKAGFHSLHLKILKSTIAEENELDLIPVKGDWFTIGILYTKK
ncbi:MAG: class I SAM-dependent methyltransferase [Candidatus Lokiarchaeota archaeon]